MLRAANPIVFPFPHRGPYSPLEQSLIENSEYVCWYERTVMHWQNHKLEWFCQEQLVFQKKETDEYWWVHEGQLVQVQSLKETMSAYFFQYGE